LPLLVDARPVKKEGPAVETAAPATSHHTDVAVITVVESSGCHFCEDALAVLAELAGSYPIAVEAVDARSPRGEELLRRHRPAMYPLVLADGQWVSAGRLPRGKLVRLLEQRRGPYPAVPAGGSGGPGRG
jgi:hypothetical protein